MGTSSDLGAGGRLRPAPAGSDAGSRLQRGELSVSLAWRRLPGEARELSGEVSHRWRGPLDRVPALLLRGCELLDRSATGASGRFVLRSPTTEPCMLWLVLGADDLIRVELDPRAETAT